MLEVKPILTEAEDSMEATILFLDESLAHIRAGKANPRILDGIKVDYYGSHVPLTNVATVTTPDAKSIVIQPWEKGLISIIEKAILNYCEENKADLIGVATHGRRGLSHFLNQSISEDVVNHSGIPVVTFKLDKD